MAIKAEGPYVAGRADCRSADREGYRDRNANKPAGRWQEASPEADCGEFENRVERSSFPRWSKAIRGAARSPDRGFENDDLLLAASACLTLFGAEASPSRGKER